MWVTFDLCVNRVVVVENIPEDVSFPPGGPAPLPLGQGLHHLLDLASRSLEIVSPVWRLNASHYDASFQHAALQVLQPHSLHKASLSLHEASLTASQPP